MKKSALLAILLLSILFSQAQYLRILDPQNWRNGQGTIEETKITYEPQGLYMKIDWEITFSAKGLNIFSESDTVEVEYRFNLPQGALVIDSWLWFGDTILEGLIMDRWSASQIYENIVNRRRDPSVLYKNGETNYELRIFPMAAKESRKVQISFLVPFTWSPNSVSAYFPAENLLATKYEIEKIDVYAKMDEGQNPIIESNEIIEFEYSGEEIYSHFASLNYEELNRNQKITSNLPMKDGAYLSFFENGDDNFYQLAALPLQNLELENPQKILFLIDYREQNSEISQSALIKEFSDNILNVLSRKDSFNIMYHGLYNGFEMHTASETWIPGDSLSITESINELGEKPFVSYSNLATLLAGGIEMIKEEDAKIILVANSDNIDDIESANQLLKDLMKLADPPAPIYIADFQTKGFDHYRVNNVWYRGNEYFYLNLAKLTGGDYCNSFDGNTFTECFQKVYQSAVSENGMIDIHTSLENGFCYGRFYPGQQSVFSNLPYLEIGKYNGDFPFEIEVSGEYAGELFSNKISLKKENAVEGDSILSQIWAGNEILEMEKAARYNSYNLISDVVEKSIDNHVLSQYTSFLCLEPGMLDQFEDLQEDQTKWRDDTNTPVTTAEQDLMQPEINVYPNPFTDRVNIEIQLSANITSSQIKFEIYDLFGKLIKTFNAEQFEALSEAKIEWDATNQTGNRVPEGTYLFVYTTPEGRISKKLVVM